MLRAIYRYCIYAVDLILSKLHIDFTYYELVFNLKRSISLSRSSTHKHFLKKDSGLEKSDNTSILFIVPSATNMHKLTRENSPYFFEICESLKETKGVVNQHFIFQNGGNWLLETILSTQRYKIDYIFIYIEVDPNLANWSLDYAIKEIRKYWNGSFVFLMYDSVYTLHVYRLRRLIRIGGKNCVVISIDRKFKTFNSENRIKFHIGPTFLPVSKSSLKFYDKKLNFKLHQPREMLLTFMGEIYPYREQLLNSLKNQDLDIFINPHRLGSHRPNYLTYLQALSNSVFTLSPARASDSNLPQLKSRILEATCFGSIIITDDDSHISKFLKKNDEYVYLKDFEGIKDLLAAYERNPDFFRQMQDRAYLKGRLYLSNVFWNEFFERCN